MTEPDILVCIRLDQAAFVPRGTTADCPCSKCGQRVLLSPSGQRFLKAHDDPVVIICATCYEPAPYDEPHLTASREELQQELETLQPNTWRNRN